MTAVSSCILKLRNRVLTSSLRPLHRIYGTMPLTCWGSRKQAVLPLPRRRFPGLTSTLNLLLGPGFSTFPVSFMCHLPFLTSLDFVFVLSLSPLMLSSFSFIFRFPSLRFVSLVRLAAPAYHEFHFRNKCRTKCGDSRLEAISSIGLPQNCIGEDVAENRTWVQQCQHSGKQQAQCAGAFVC